jgi:hypothetical protein
MHVGLHTSPIFSKDANHEDPLSPFLERQRASGQVDYLHIFKNFNNKFRRWEVEIWNILKSRGTRYL